MKKAGEGALARSARLSARPGAASDGMKPGLHPLGLRQKRDALLYVPKSYDSRQRIPLVVSLHGAGGNEQHGVDLLRSAAERHGVAALSPASRESTWDVIVGDFGPDVAFLDQALERVFASCNVDPQRLAIGGFSDGASYALTLGLTNGDLFTNIFAFSPGFTANPSRAGKPGIFVSHGVHDQVLSIDYCSRRLVPRLRAAGYEVDYREFDGPHTVPPEMITAAMNSFPPGRTEAPKP